MYWRKAVVEVNPLGMDLGIRILDPIDTGKPEWDNGTRRDTRVKLTTRDREGERSWA